MSLVNAAPPDSGTPRNTRCADVNESLSGCPPSRKYLKTSMKSAPLSAMSIAMMRIEMRFMRAMSIAPVMSSAKVASPSWVAVMRGELIPSVGRLACSRPLSAVSECTKASCSSNWWRSYSENAVAERRRMRVGPAAALAIRLGSISTRTLWCTKKRLICSCSSACSVSAERQ